MHSVLILYMNMIVNGQEKKSLLRIKMLSFYHIACHKLVLIYIKISHFNDRLRRSGLLLSSFKTDYLPELRGIVIM